jgi:hypothetical protein
MCSDVQGEQKKNEVEIRAHIALSEGSNTTDVNAIT